MLDFHPDSERTLGLSVVPEGLYIFFSKKKNTCNTCLSLCELDNAEIHKEAKARPECYGKQF